MITMPKSFGEHPDYPTGSVFASRQEILKRGLHRHNVRGISVVSAQEGANAIIISGGYGDHFDPHHIIYSGQGKGGDQRLDQGDNRAMVTSCEQKKPLRVFRGGKHLHLPGVPKGQYRYEGLYQIDRYWTEPGSEGFLVCKFELSPWKGPRVWLRPALPKPTPPIAPRVHTSVSKAVSQWPAEIPTDYYPVIDYLDKHPEITETVLIQLLGGAAQGARRARNFARNIQAWQALLGWELELHSSEHGKIYRKRKS